MRSSTFGSAANRERAGRAVTGTPFHDMDGKLRATRAIKASEMELKDCIRTAINAGIQVTCTIDGKRVNIADLTITIDMRGRAPP